ncbi:MAG: hypothetical protein BWY12_02628 [candidate division BRC1 bacterium ADurb.Bin183]|nr:MAG: hypothetical protein BWY12_02628 [candidate division BRC1 bacterium ADurb.Bin183]
MNGFFIFGIARAQESYDCLKQPFFVLIKLESLVVDFHRVNLDGFIFHRQLVKKGISIVILRHIHLFCKLLEGVAQNHLPLTGIGYIPVERRLHPRDDVGGYLHLSKTQFE